MSSRLLTSLTARMGQMAVSRSQSMAISRTGAIHNNLGVSAVATIAGSNPQRHPSSVARTCCAGLTGSQQCRSLFSISTATTLMRTPTFSTTSLSVTGILGTKYDHNCTIFDGPVTQFTRTMVTRKKRLERRKRRRLAGKAEERKAAAKVSFVVLFGWM